MNIHKLMLERFYNEYMTKDPMGGPVSLLTLEQVRGALKVEGDHLLKALEALMKQAAKDAESYAPNGNEAIWAYIADAADVIAKARGQE